MLNHFTVQVRITDEPRLQYSEKERGPVCTFMGEWTRKEQDEKDSTSYLYLHCSVWKDRGTAFHQRYRKGDYVILEGELAHTNKPDRNGMIPPRIELTVKNYHRCTPPEQVGRTTVKAPEVDNIVSQMSDAADAMAVRIRGKVQQWGDAIEEALREALDEVNKRDQ